MSTAPTSPLRDANPQDPRRQYDEEGYVILRDVLDAGLVGEAREHVAWLLRRHPDLRPEALDCTDLDQDPFWVRLVSDPRLLDVAEQFIGPDIALFASHYICKPPRTGRPVLWHQDGSYWPLEPMDVSTLWLAVDESTPENGCMRVIPRTQTLMLQETHARTDQESVLGSSMDEALVDESQAVDIILRPGDISMHHPNIIHGSNANHSEKWRRGLTIRYIPATTRILRDPWPSAFLLRGRAVPGINHYSPWPRYDPIQHMPFIGCETWNERIRRE